MGRKKKYDRVGRPSDHPEIRICWEEDGQKKSFAETFKTFVDAAKKINGNPKLVRLCTLGQALSHKGYKFEFVDPEYHREEIDANLSDRGRDYSGCRSRYPGIVYHVPSGKWHVFYNLDGHRMYHATRRTHEEAVLAQQEICAYYGLPWPIGMLHW